MFVGDNADNQIVHNHIHDLFYSGISVGSVQDFGPCQATGNVVEYNHVHDIGQGMLSDLAGIYTCSTPKSRIAFNVVHDVARRDYGGWGIYPDEGSHDLLIRKNLVYRCQDGALFAHHNRDITAENNIFAFNRGAQVERGGIGGFELTCRRNLVYYTEGKAVGDYGSEHTRARRVRVRPQPVLERLRQAGPLRPDELRRVAGDGAGQGQPRRRPVVRGPGEGRFPAAAGLSGGAGRLRAVGLLDGRAASVGGEVMSVRSALNPPQPPQPASRETPPSAEG